MSRRERPIPASVADADESGNIIEGTDRYASSVAPSSPAKEQPNTGRARRDKARRDSSSPITTSVLTDSDSTVHPRRDALKKPSRDRDKSVSSKKALMAATRPSVKHAKTTTSLPKKDVEASYYGVEPTVTPATSRPRAQTRPSSYYASSRPPMSNTRFYANQTPGPSLPTSFPPPSWPGPMPGSMPQPFGSPSPAPLVMQHHPPPPTPEYFARPLESRFGNVRPQSAMGYRPPPALEYDEYEEPFDKSLARRPSTTRKVSKNDEADRRSMPPPPRSASARPGALAFRPPPSTPARGKVDFHEHDRDADLFNDLSPLAPLPPGSYEYASSIPFRLRESVGPSFGYDAPDYPGEIVSKGRRNSFFGGNSVASGSAYEDKLRQATRYQDGVVGGPPMPLTAETLRKAGRSGASSRSTGSSGSHDESDYRTRTTRSTAPNDEDFTIRVKGSTVLKFGNAEMQCQDGAEINISSRGGNPEIRAIGSDRSSYMDLDDRRTRIDIPQSRARAQSRAKSRPRSFSRSFSKFDAAAVHKYDVPARVEAPAPSRFDPGPRYDRYDVGLEYDSYSPYPPPLPPPYPEYPSSYSSRHGDGYFGGPPL